jgi:predicted DNA-binding transcriptional regulator YafY
MSKREFLQRYNLIRIRVSKSPCTFKEIVDYLAMESDLQGYNYRISKRTFVRDLEDIRSLFNTDIQYNFAKHVYEVASDQPEVRSRMLEAFDIFNALNIGENLTGLVDFEKRKPQGTENLFGLLHSIRNQLIITFTYQKYWEEGLTQRTLEPLALKEFRNRWYILGKDMKDNRIKSFALDRLTNLEIGKKKFKRPANFNVTEHYRHCFGIISPEENQQVEEVIISFTQIQGKYIKSLPLHESQQVIVDNEEELRIRLNIYITHDFLMELLSYGANLKAISPVKLSDEIVAVNRNSLNRYQANAK